MKSTRDPALCAWRLSLAIPNRRRAGIGSPIGIRMAGSFVCYRLETRSKPHRSSGHREPSWTQLARAAKEDAAASMQHGSRGAKRQSVATARQRQRSACCSSRWGGPLQLAVRGACSGQQPAGPAHAVTAGGVFADVCGSQRPGRDVRDNRCSVDSGHGGLEVVDAHGRERYANVVGRRPPVRRRNRGPPVLRRSVATSPAPLGCMLQCRSSQESSFRSRCFVQRR